MSEGNEPEIIPETEAQAPPAETVETETPETTEETAEGKEPEAETTEETEQTEESERPKRESQNKRLKRKNQYLQSEILRLTELANKSPPETAKTPKEEDFGGDWGKYIAATAAFEAAKAVNDTLTAKEKAANESKIAELRSDVLSDFEERAEDFKAKAKDFDDVVSKYVNNGGKFSDVVRELVMDSELGPQLTYHFAKNPALANRINDLPPLQAAKAIRDVELSLLKPSTKPTKAVAPVTPVKGGSSGNFDPANASMEEYVAKRKAGWKG